jgi:alkylhydroperoxidase family enzyme
MVAFFSPAEESNMMSARIPPAPRPYAEAIQRRLEKIMGPGREPLVLFTTLARDERLFDRFTAGGLLDRGHLSLRQREIVIDRVTASCRSEYEWGVHVTMFAEKAKLTAEQIVSLQRGGPGDDCWEPADVLLIRLCDALHANSDVDDALWTALTAHFGAEAMLELLLLAGFYRTVSYLTNALRLPLESWAARFSGDDGR